MAAPYKKTLSRNFSITAKPDTKDTLYWKNLEFPVTRSEYGAINSVHFNTVKPYKLAVTSSLQVELFDDTCAPYRSFSKFKGTAYSGHFREDGDLLVAGGEEGRVRVFDPKKALQLRQFKGHAAPVHVTDFTKDGVHVISASDDKSVKLWDISLAEEIQAYNEHQDYIRCGFPSHTSKDLYLTGSYDHTVRLYDTRAPSSVLSVNHGEPVEAVLMFPSGGMFISAGGNTVKIWNTLSGGRLLTSFTHHHKAIMDMCFCTDYKRLMTASLDRHLKIVDLSSYEVVHSMNFPCAITSVDVAPDDSMLVVGMSDGMLSMQKRKAGGDDLKNKQDSHFRHRRTRQYQPAQSEDVVTHTKRVLMTKYDKMLRAFEHTRALDAAFDYNVRLKNPEITVAVLQQLIKRGTLRSALDQREEKSLTTILKFLVKHIGNPQYSGVLLDVANCLLDLYAHEVGQSSRIDEMLMKLKRAVSTECTYINLLNENLGAIDTIIAMSQMSSTTPTEFMVVPKSISGLEANWVNKPGDSIPRSGNVSVSVNGDSVTLKLQNDADVNGQSDAEINGQNDADVNGQSDTDIGPNDEAVNASLNGTAGHEGDSSDDSESGSSSSGDDSADESDAESNNNMDIT